MRKCMVVSGVTDVPYLDFQFLTNIEDLSVTYYTIGWIVISLCVLILFNCVLCGLTPCHCMCCHSIILVFLRHLSLSSDFVEKYTAEIPVLNTMSTRSTKMQDLIDQKNALNGVSIIVMLMAFLLSIYFGFIDAMFGIEGCSVTDVVSPVDLYQHSKGLDVTIGIALHSIGSASCDDIFPNWAQWTSHCPFDTDNVLTPAATITVDANELLYNRGAIELHLDSPVKQLSITSTFRHFGIFGMSTVKSVNRRYQYLMNQNQVTLSGVANATFSIPVALQSVYSDQLGFSVQFDREYDTLAFSTPDVFPINDSRVHQKPLSSSPGQFIFDFVPDQAASHGHLIQCPSDVVDIIALFTHVAIFIAMFPVVRIVLEVLHRMSPWLVPVMVITVSLLGFFIPFAGVIIAIFFLLTPTSYWFNLIAKAGGVSLITGAIMGLEATWCLMIYIVVFIKNGGLSLLVNFKDKWKLARLRKREANLQKKALKARQTNASSSNPLTGPVEYEGG